MYVAIGVSTTDPVDWDGTTPPMDMPNTWCMVTTGGQLYIDGVLAGCKTTKNGKFSEELGYEEIVSLSLYGDRSVSITHIDSEVTQVFTDLPDVPLWVVIYKGVYKMDIVEKGK